MNLRFKLLCKNCCAHAQTLDYARAATEDSFSNTDPVVGKTGGDMDSLWVDMEKGEDAFLGRATIGQVLRNNPDK